VSEKQATKATVAIAGIARFTDVCAGLSQFYCAIGTISARKPAISPLGSASLLLDLVFARKPKTAHSLLWFAAIKCLECVKDPAGLAPKGCLIAAETIEREIGQVGQSQKAASELDIGSVDVFPRVGYRFHITYSTVRTRLWERRLSYPGPAPFAVHLELSAKVHSR